MKFKYHKPYTAHLALNLGDKIMQWPGSLETGGETDEMDVRGQQPGAGSWVDGNLIHANW
ncbi:MAG: hypothetical protein HUK00_03420 [Bacteroidaceae bacterium]|nr:hypothetical protein [Bacteroidaceae bacterium]